jgi:hypothetical protein
MTMAVSMNKAYKTPGVYLESQVPEKEFVLETGIPVFVGLIRKRDLDAAGMGSRIRSSQKAGVVRVEPLSQVAYGYKSGLADYFPMFTTFASVKEAMGDFLNLAFLGLALRGFYENGGKKCFVHPVCYDDDLCLVHEAMTQALLELEDLTGADLICAPDLGWLYREDETVSAEDVFEMQNRMLGHCVRITGRFAVLDALPGADTNAVIVQRKSLKGDNGALYHPWLKTMGAGDAGEQVMAPPCGHVCGIFKRSDDAKGVHKAPANEEIQGVTDVETWIGNSEQDALNPEHVNCIRSFPGRGIRIWGARTVSRYPEWTYVNVRRLFLTLSRWLEGYMTRLVFEPNGSALWARITREITGFLNSQFLAGALKGNRAKEAFYVTCDSSTNTEDMRDLGCVVTEIGLAPASPCEFIIIRIVHSDGGTLISEGPDIDQGQGGTVTPVVSPVLPAVVITHIEYTVEGPDFRGEYVVIENRDTRDMELGNWTLLDMAGHVYTFPNLTIGRGNVCRIWTRTGTDSTQDLFWGMNHAVWNNTGDQAVLRDRVGRTVCVYGYAGR